MPTLISLEVFHGDFWIHAGGHLFFCKIWPHLATSPPPAPWSLSLLEPVLVAPFQSGMQDPLCHLLSHTLLSLTPHRHPPLQKLCAFRKHLNLPHLYLKTQPQTICTQRSLNPFESVVLSIHFCANMKKRCLGSYLPRVWLCCGFDDCAPYISDAISVASVPASGPLPCGRSARLYLACFRAVSAVWVHFHSARTMLLSLIAHRGDLDRGRGCCPSS